MENADNLQSIDPDSLPDLTEYRSLVTKLIAYGPLYGKATYSNVKKNAERQKLVFDFDMPYQEAAEYFADLGVIDADTFYSDLEQYAGQAFTISRISSIETLLGVQEYIATQLDLGNINPGELREAIQQYAVSNGDSPLEPWHLDTVVRTNYQTAFSKGRYESQKASSLPLWGYVATVDGRETDLCNSLDGKAFPKDDPFWDEYYPPNHFNCRSEVVVLDEETARDFGYKVQDNGSDYLAHEQSKNPDASLQPGKGFNTSPDRGLSKYLEQKTTELGIENVKTAEPV
jgi:SPP1 gp7 family putative phage head morphogenesis protein